MPRVEITTDGHAIVVDADGNLDQVAAKALYLWTRTRDPQPDRPFPVGFTPPDTERADDGPTNATGFDVDLGHP